MDEDGVWNFRAGGLIIATSHSADFPSGQHSGTTPLGDAQATRTLLELDDEYDSRGHHGHDRRHVTCERGPFMRDEKGLQRVAVGGIGLTVAGTNTSSLPASELHAHRHDSVIADDARRGGRSPAGVVSEKRLPEAKGWLRGEDQCRGSSSDGDEGVDDDDDERLHAAREWLMDHEEVEEKERLIRREMARQRGRVEELYELHRVYSKATKKTFRALRGMPEPSFDAPACCYEEDLDAAAERALYGSESAVVQGAELGEDDDDETVHRDQVRTSEELFSHMQPHEHHVDCLDEGSVLAASAIGAACGGKGFVYRMRNLDVIEEEE
jgi:hypothetical protein